MRTSDAVARSELSIPADRENFVYLRGRLAERAVERDLPSGDVLATFRLTVSRPPGNRAPVDSLECVTVKARIRRTLAGAEPGRELEVTGALQRRFWRSPAGPASRYAVDVETLRLLKPDPRAGASRARKRVSV